MQYFKTGFITVVIIGGLLAIGASNFVYAADDNTAVPQKPCEACIATSPQVAKYISFANEILSAMLTYANRPSSVLDKKNNSTGGNETNGSYVLGNISSAIDTTNTIAQFGASSLYTSFLTVGEMITDSRKGIGPITNSQPFQRDWRLIDAVDQRTINAILDLGNAGVLVRFGFKDGRKERVATIVRKYSTGDNAILANPNMTEDEWFQGWEVLGGLRRMNQAVKTSLSRTMGNINNLNNNFMGAHVTFSKQFQQGIIEYYDCARGVAGMAACSTKAKDASKQFSSIVKNGKKETTRAVDVFETALTRLKGFFAKNGSVERDALLQRSKELLRDENGLKGIRKDWWNGTKESFISAWKDSKEFITSLDSPVKGLFYRQKQKEAAFTVGDIQSTVILNQQGTSLLIVANETDAQARNARHQSVFVDTSRIVTNLFPQITQEIMIAKYIIDGKNDDKNIVQSLGTACQYQCTNVPGTCFYSSSTG